MAAVGGRERAANCCKRLAAAVASCRHLEQIGGARRGKRNCASVRRLSELGNEPSHYVVLAELWLRLVLAQLVEFLLVLEVGHLSEDYLFGGATRELVSPPFFRFLHLKMSTSTHPVAKIVGKHKPVGKRVPELAVRV